MSFFSLTYDFNPPVFDSASIYVTANNLLLITPFDFGDPERSSFGSGGGSGALEQGVADGVSLSGRQHDGGLRVRVRVSGCSGVFVDIVCINVSSDTQPRPNQTRHRHPDTPAAPWPAAPPWARPPEPGCDRDILPNAAATSAPAFEPRPHNIILANGCSDTICTDWYWQTAAATAKHDTGKRFQRYLTLQN